MKYRYDIGLHLYRCCLDILIEIDQMVYDVTSKMDPVKQGKCWVLPYRPKNFTNCRIPENNEKIMILSSTNRSWLPIMLDNVKRFLEHAWVTRMQILAFFVHVFTHVNLILTSTSRGQYLEFMDPENIMSVRSLLLIKYNTAVPVVLNLVLQGVSDEPRPSLPPAWPLRRF